MPFSVLDPLVGVQQIAMFGLPDTTARVQPGLIVTAVDNYWGAGEFMYVKANGTITAGAICALNPVITSGLCNMLATEVTNTAIMGRPIGVAMTPMTTGQFGWLCISGLVPVKSNATVAADTTFSIVAAGQAGVLTAGKQIVNGRVAIAATQTVAKAGCTSNSSSTRLTVPSADGWFIGAYLSGTGIAALTVVSDIDPSGTQVTLSVATTAAVNGTVTATYNNATIFYNVAHLNRPFAQGAIT
jgi:hypothetical protein